MRIRVRLPNGKVTTAEVSARANKGYRYASVRVMGRWGDRVRISGRVTNRHGYNDDRILPFEVNMDCVNALTAFAGKKIYVKA